METVGIGNIGKIITGKTPPTIRTELFGEGYPFITPSDISSFDIRYLVDVERGLSERGYNYQKKLLLPPDAVCYVCIGSTVGKICMTKISSFSNQQINSIICDKNKCNPFFLFYKLRLETPRIRSIADCKGSGKSIINKEEFSNFQITLPSLNIQQKIASILSAYDDLIENNLRRVKILEEIAQTIYREWFVNFRFPWHERVKMIKSELGMIPEGWEVKKIGDVCNVVMGQSPKSEYYNTEGNGLPFHQGVRDFDSRFPTHTTYCTLESRIAKQGDILISVRAPVGRINLASEKLIIGRGLSAIRHKHGLQSFLLYHLKHIFQEEDSMGSGTIYKAITKDDLLNVKVIQPSREFDNKFNKLVSPMDAEIENLTLRIKNLRKTRDLLLPKLISGKIDVEQLDINTN